MRIRDRIKEFRRVKASDLAPNPRNWRIHTQGQQDAMRGILAEVGYAGAVLARETPDGSLEASGLPPMCCVPRQGAVEYKLPLRVSSSEADLNPTRLQENRVMSEDYSSVAYRSVQGFPAYRVGDDGSVWTCWLHANPNVDGRCNGASYVQGMSWRELAPRFNRTGYRRVVLFPGDGTRVTHAVHLLVLKAFVGPRPSGMVACHKNDMKADNRLSNLRWDTPSSNWDDRRRNSRMGNRKGEQHPMAKLTESDVRDIRSLDHRGIPSMALAKIHYVTHGTIRLIVTRKSWKHIA